MRCTHCGAALGPGAAWCSLCLATVEASTAAAEPAAPALAYARPGYAGYPEPVQQHPEGGPPAWEPEPWSPQPPHPAWPQAAAEPPPWQPASDLAPAPPRRAATWTTLAAIGVGALVQGVMWLLTRNAVVENEALIRYAIVSTLVVYGIVTWLVVGRIESDGHPLRWRGSWGIAPSAVLGLAVGGSLAWIGLQASRAAGVGGGDERIALLVSEGDVPHIAAAFLITVVAAPVVEELLFRGLLMSSLMHRGTRVALWLSALAFAAWHLNPSALRYYTWAGALLGFLYLKRGLACSIAAHAAFNGTLLVAAVSYALAPGPVVARDGLTLSAPHGWHEVADGPFTHLRGPSGGEVVAFAIPNPSGVREDPAEIVGRIQTGLMTEVAAFAPRTDTARTVELPAGEAVRLRVVVDGRDGDLVLLPTEDHLYLVVLGSGGSARARDDFDEMLTDLRVS